MRVCADVTFDPLGNQCNWQGCAWQDTAENDHFGGCDDNLTAGTLCCEGR